MSSSLAQNVKSKTKEGAKEFVTAGDLGSHIVMRYGFEKAFPSITVTDSSI